LKHDLRDLAILHLVCRNEWMKVKVDSAGRVALPKNVRDHFQLKAGSFLELEESAEGILLKPAERSPSMILRNGR